MKDYVNAKLLYCHPPPTVHEDDFNAETREIALQRAAGKKRAPVTRVTKNADTFVAAAGVPGSTTAANSGHKTKKVDQDFFNNNGALAARPQTQGIKGQGQEFSRGRIYPHQNSVADDGTPLSGRRARIAAVIAASGGEIQQGKKHHKRMKRTKQRSGKGYDD